MDLIQSIFEAGVVGCGGAGFPTHVKYQNTVAHLIVNAAECEPLLRTDRYLILNHADRLLKALALVASHLKAKQATIALKKTYQQEIRCLEAEIDRSGSPVELLFMDNYYPAGDEQMVVYEATGKAVPPGGIPLDVGAVVSNVATLLSVLDAVEGIPVTHRVLTVAGEVAKPVVVRVPIGTAIEKCIALAGGPSTPQWACISGGPLMGKVLSREEVGSGVVTKTTSGILVVKEDSHLARQSEISVAHMLNRAKSACIQCSQCTQFCPRYLAGHPLQPHLIMRKLAYGGLLTGQLNDRDVQQSLICCECGICTQYACPMQLQPSRVNTLLKQEYAAAGIRYSKDEEEGAAGPRRERDLRKVPSKRIAARIGVLKYYDWAVEKLVEYTGSKVEIPLQQHIGAPSQPVVSDGERVTAGELIAKCPQNKLGANIHASIDGIVSLTETGIVIQGKEGGDGHG